MTILESKNRRASMMAHASRPAAGQSVPKTGQYIIRLHKEERNEPGLFTMAEMKAELAEADEDIRMGRVYSSAEVRKMTEMW